jgi:hypothetical protein
MGVYVMALLAAVCFVVCHGGPADHFATFAEQVPGVEIHATGPALSKLEERGVKVDHPFSLKGLSPEQEDALAEQIAKECSNASVCMTDVGHVFDVKVQKALTKFAPHVVRIAYYDNPESYVPGGYSDVAHKVMSAAHKVLFANSHLATSMSIDNVEKIGLGYYPLHHAEKIGERRKLEHFQLRRQWFEKHRLKDRGQKLLVYCGGNNEEYFTKAFPAFLSFLKEAKLEKSIVLFQQHPGATVKYQEGELERLIENRHPIFLSDLSSEEAQVVADGMMYYQTSMGPQFILAGIPVIQVGHEIYPDIVVRNRLCPSVTSAKELQIAVQAIGKGSTPQKETILEGLGIKSNWVEILKENIK